MQDSVIRPLSATDEPILWEMLYQAIHQAEHGDAPPRDIVQRPEFARYVEGWGRPGDIGFAAYDTTAGSALGAVWLRVPQEEERGGVPNDQTPELAFAVTMGQRGRGIGTALLTQLVRATPEQSAISLNVSAGKPVLRLYERFGFRPAEQRGDAVIMRRDL